MNEKLQINSNFVILMEYENKVQNEKYYEDFPIQKIWQRIEMFFLRFPSSMYYLFLKSDSEF